MKIKSQVQVFTIAGNEVQIGRTNGGVVEIWGEDDVALARGLGYAHAHDRMIQMMLVRLIGQGRLSECLRSDEETLGIDTFMREMGFAHSAAQSVQQCTPETLAFAEAYSEGVNAYLATGKRPFEFRLLGYHPEPWSVEDTLTTVQLMAYIGLAQSQQDAEKLIIQSLQQGVSLERLQHLFSPHLDDFNPAMLETLKDVRLEQPLLPKEVRFLSALPKMMASNNWVVGGQKSESGSPLSCNDPHLECNRLPAIWCEVVMHTSDDFRLGVTMPGVPAIVMGRTRELSMHFTYGFMDLVDYFVEDCKDGKVRRGEDYEAISAREETILRKKNSPVTIRVYETSHGVIERDSMQDKLEDGLYLCRAWAGYSFGAGDSLNALHEVLSCSTVEEAQQALRKVTISCNWLLADAAGNIGYQQSGCLPARQHSGLYPLPGWEEQWSWQGMVPSEQRTTMLNPDEGFLVTANNDFNTPGLPLSLNLPMGSYRADRISAMIEEKERHNLEDMKRIQRDLYSLQAETYMKLLRPLLPSNKAGDILQSWDLCYDKSSQGAVLFEAWYEDVLREVFGKGLLGVEAWDTMTEQTGVHIDYYHLFDRILLENHSDWFVEEGRDELFQRILFQVCDEASSQPIPTWGQERQVMMTNLFFAGKLPRFLGFDHGPISLEGNRATVVQGAIYQAHGRLTTFCPSYRAVTDMSQSFLETALAGGPSDRRLSRYYRNDVQNWLAYKYKVLSATSKPVKS